MNTWNKNESGAEGELHDLEKRLEDAVMPGSEKPVGSESHLSGTDDIIDLGPELELDIEALEDVALLREDKPYSLDAQDGTFSGANEMQGGAEEWDISVSDAGSNPDTMAMNSGISAEEDVYEEHKEHEEQNKGETYQDQKGFPGDMTPDVSVDGSSPEQEQGFEDHEAVPGKESMAAGSLIVGAAGADSPIDLLPVYRDFVFESRDGRFLFSGPEIQTLEENAPIRSYCQVVADFYTSPGPGVMMVEGNHKYAAVLGRRQLQRQGEITDEFVLHPLQNLKMGKNQSALFYQFIPRSDQTRLHVESEKAPEGFLLHDTVSLLAGFLKKMKRDSPVALALHLPEAVLVVAGDHKRVVWARRYTLAGEDLAALKDGFEVISQDIQIARREAGMDVREILWIESLTKELIWPDHSREEVCFTRLPVSGLQKGEDTWYSSLPGMIDSVPRSTSLSEPAERAMVEVGRWEKWILTSLLCLALMIAGAGAWMHQHLNGLENQIRQLSSYKGRLQGEYASLAASVGFTRKESAQVKDAGEAAAKVQRVDQSIPLAAVWNSLARLRPASCRIQALELTYENTQAKLRLEGVIDLGLTQAQAVYSAFLAALEKGGFVVKQQSFQLDVDSNFFSMVLEKPFTE